MLAVYRLPTQAGWSLIFCLGLVFEPFGISSITFQDPDGCSRAETCVAQPAKHRLQFPIILQQLPKVDAAVFSIEIRFDLLGFIGGLKSLFYGPPGHIGRAPPLSKITEDPHRP